MQPISRVIRRKFAVSLVKKRYTVAVVATLVGCSMSTITRAVKRMTYGGHVSDLPRSGRPATYPEAFKLTLIGFYCQTRPFAEAGRWTLRWASIHLAAKPDVLNATPSKSTIHRILKENALKPHQSRYFLHITDPDFFPKMDQLIALYSSPPDNLFFFDECPGIQILKRLVPDLRTEKTRKRLEEFEYIRNGTMNVLAFFNHADGKVFAQCQADHKTDTFLAIFKSHVATCPSRAPLHYVMDNLSTHRGYPFCKVVAELSAVTCPSETELKDLQKRVEWLKSTNKRIIIHFTPYHGSWLNLVEFWFGIMNKKVLNESYGSAQELMTSFEAFLEQWNTQLAHPFDWTYTGKELHEKVVVRFIEILRQAADKLETTTLTKQLCLMSNLFAKYYEKVAINKWEKLLDVVRVKEAVIRNSIMDEQGPIKKENAKNSLDALLLTLDDHFGKYKQKAA